MRDITFRAWDNVDKKYYFELETTIYFDEMFFNQERYIVEQYTGLKDKNGVEIYENDVLKINNDYDFIEFQDYSFCTHNQHEPLANYVYDTVSGDPKFLDDVFEVIGNVHENADLLEEQ